jgi:hypothetical protein
MRIGHQWIGLERLTAYPAGLSTPDEVTDDRSGENQDASLVGKAEP